jgi:hypothetical protein
MEYIQALERKSGTMVLTRKEGTASRIMGYKPGEREIMMPMNNKREETQEETSTSESCKDTAAPIGPQKHAVDNPYAPAYHQVPPPQQYRPIQSDAIRDV